MQCEDIVSTYKVLLGKLSKLCCLQNKIINFLYEFHTEDFHNLNFPSLPSHHSSFDLQVMYIPYTLQSCSDSFRYELCVIAWSNV